jgi:hypothetical protein
VRFLIDAHLPRRLVCRLRDAGHDAIHTLDLPNGNHTTDAEINAISLRENRVVSEHRDETDMGNLDELLIVLAAQGHLLLPQGILADHEGAKPFRDEEINDPTAGRVQHSIDTAIALRRHLLQMAGGVAVLRVLLMCQTCLLLSALFVVELVAALLAAWLSPDEPGPLGAHQRLGHRHPMDRGHDYRSRHRRLARR